MLLVSQFHFVYWHNIVRVLLTRSTSTVDVKCMFSRDVTDSESESDGIRHFF